jgi:hypothetical protein
VLGESHWYGVLSNTAVHKTCDLPEIGALGVNMP